MDEETAIHLQLFARRKEKKTMEGIAGFWEWCFYNPDKLLLIALGVIALCVVGLIIQYKVSK